MGQHWCDRGQSLWPVEQMENPPLEIYRPANFLGAVYNHVQVSGAYTLRSLFYAELFHEFRGGHDPHSELDWDVVRSPDQPHMLVWTSDSVFTVACSAHCSVFLA